MQPTRPKLPLRVKWASALVVVGVAPLAASAIVVLGIQRRGLESAEREVELAAVDQVSETLRADVREIAERTTRAARVLSDARVTDEDARLALAEESLTNADALDSIALFDAGGKFIDAISRGKRETYSAPDLPKAALEAKEATWIDPPAARGELEYLVPLASAGGEVHGWALGVAAHGGLSRRVVDLSRVRFNAPDRIAIVDDEMRVLAGDATGALPPGKRLAGRDVFARVIMTKPDFAKDVLATAQWDDDTGARMIGTMKTVPERGWAIVVRRPESEAFGALREARRAFFASIGALVFFAVVVGLFLARRTTRPIQSLVALTRAYGRRELERTSDVRTGDELEELGDSLAEMAGKLRTSENEITRRAAVEANLARYMPKEIAQEIAAGRTRLELGGTRKSITVLFADVTAFTSFAERAAPERAVAFLNELFSILSEVVFRHHGMVDKFMGDCIMAVFGTDGAEDHAALALAAAEDMHRFVEANARAWKTKYDFDVRLGIGVATGDALVGNLGSDTRLEYTAIGDAVNVASRLEGLARPGQTLLTEDVAREVAGGGFQLNSLGKQPIRGKREHLEVFELVP
jgi:adenylate cyclase